MNGYNWFKINEIIISIINISLLNLYIIFKSGLLLNIPFSTNSEYYIDGNSILKISEKEIIILLIINLTYMIIFNNNSIQEKIYSLSLRGAYQSFEFVFILLTTLLGLNLICLSNDFINLFLSIEVYSLAVYLLILFKFSKINSLYSILYFIFNTVGSFLLLFSFILLYYFTGILSFDNLERIIISNPETTLSIGGVDYGVNSIIYTSLMLIFISLIFKLGLAPFHFWVIRVYKVLENNILLYLLFIPKLIYLFVFFKFLFILIPTISYFPPHFISSSFYFFLFISVLSCLIGSIAGLFHNQFNLLMSYSSIFNLGFFFFGLFHFFFYSLVDHPLNLDISYFYNSPLFEYLFIYLFNLLALFFAYFLYTHKVTSFNLFSAHSKKHPLAIVFIISIFSFIGVPPFAGFFAKLNIFNHILINPNLFSFISILFLFLVTLFSASLYLKFIYALYFNKSSSTIDSSQELPTLPLNISFYLSLFTLILVLYPFISIYFTPFFYIIL